MIIEYTYSPHDLVKKCYGCAWLELEAEWYGNCVCPNNKIKNRQRGITDRACSFKKRLPRLEV